MLGSINKLSRPTKAIILAGLILIIPLTLLWGMDALAVKKATRKARKSAGRTVRQITPPPRNYFYWGAKITPSATTLLGQTGVAENFDEAINDQLNYAKDLGMSVVKANWEERSGTIDNFVNWAAARNLKIVIQLEDPTISDFWKEANYNRAYELAKKIATRYRGKVAYYQLANEINGACIKPNAIGKVKEDFDPAKWGVMKEWLRGLSQGVHDGDPGAKKIITYNWKGVGILELIREAGINFDVIGNNWYSDMGNFFESFDINRVYWNNMAEYLWDKYHMDIWVTETNQHKGTYNATPEGQASFIRGFAEAAYGSPYIKAFLIYQMADDVNKQNTETGQYGIVGLRYEGNRWKLSDKKPAFEALKSVISTRPGFPK